MNSAFWFGILMIAYDAAGHGSCALARVTGPTGAYLWNTYSRLIWPSLTDSLIYDLHWFLWFSTAIALIILGRRAEPRITLVGQYP